MLKSIFDMKTCDFIWSKIPENFEISNFGKIYISDFLKFSESPNFINKFYFSITEFGLIKFSVFLTFI